MQATPLYEEIVTSGGLDAADTRIAKGGELHAAFELLAEVGLVVKSDDGTTWRAVDPAAVQARVVAPLGQQGAELIAESAHWAQSFNALSQTWRRSPSAVGAPFAEIRGLPTINNYLAALAGDVRDELLTAQPQYRRGIKRLSQAGAREIEALKRGVRVRTLYQHAARRGADTRRYVAAVTAAGAEVRTLDEFFNRLIVFDRRIAVIPSHEGLDVAMVISEPSTVVYLVDMFERHWERARPVHQQRDVVDARHRGGAAGDDHPDAARGARRPGRRQAARCQPAHVRRLRGGPEERVRGRDAVPARLRDGQARHLRPGDRRVLCLIPLDTAREEGEGSTSVEVLPSCRDGPVGEASGPELVGG